MSKSFSQLFEKSILNIGLKGKVVSGLVVDISKDDVIIDVGLKSEGKVSKSEFLFEEDQLKQGSSVNVYVGQVASRNGGMILSRLKAKQIERWEDLEKKFAAKEPVEGIITSSIKGGFIVDLKGVEAFLPGSQVEVEGGFKNFNSLINQALEFEIINMNPQIKNIIISRKSIFQKQYREKIDKLMKDLKVGNILQGKIKNITNNIVFVDLGGVTGVIPFNQLSWKIIKDPKEVVTVGEEVEVKVIDYDKQKNHIFLSKKELDTNPWDTLPEEYKVGNTIKGEITKIMEYGAFIIAKEGIEGLLHASEISWLKKNVDPKEMLHEGDKIEVVILDIDQPRRRMSLSLKQTTVNPWEDLKNKYPINSIFKGKIAAKDEYHLIVNMVDSIDGYIDYRDLSWTKATSEILDNYSVGDDIEAKIVRVDRFKNRVELRVKDLIENPIKIALESLNKGSVVTGIVDRIEANFLTLKVKDALEGVIKKQDLSRYRDSQRTDRFAPGEKVDAMIINIDRNTGQLGLSIRAYEVNMEKEAMKQYGSSDSGASLGEILGVVLAERDQKEENLSTTKSVKKESEQKESVLDEKISDKAKKEESTESEDIEHKQEEEKKPVVDDKQVDKKVELQDKKESIAKEEKLKDKDKILSKEELVDTKVEDNKTSLNTKDEDKTEEKS